MRRNDIETSNMFLLFLQHHYFLIYTLMFISINN